MLVLSCPPHVGVELSRLEHGRLQEATPLKKTGSPSPRRPQLPIALRRGRSSWNSPPSNLDCCSSWSCLNATAVENSQAHSFFTFTEDTILWQSSLTPGSYALSGPPFVMFLALRGKGWYRFLFGAEHPTVSYLCTSLMSLCINCSYRNKKPLCVMRVRTALIHG